MVYYIGALILIFVLVLLYFSKSSKSTKQKLENKKDNMTEPLTQTNTLSDKISDFLSKQNKFLHSLSLA